MHMVIVLFTIKLKVSLDKSEFCMAVVERFSPKI